MYSDRRYIYVGVFIIASLFALIFLGVWLAHGLSSARYYTYIAVFQERVDGLNVGSDVKYNGVPVGKVNQIRLDFDNPSNVDVYMDITEGTPITTDTYATLIPQGITGLNYIGLQITQNKKQAELLVPRWTPPYPKVPTRLSLFTNVTTQITQIAENISNLTEQLHKVANNDNVANLNQILSNLAKVSQSFASSNQHITQSLANLDKMLANLTANSGHLDSMVLNITNTSKEVATASAELSNLSRHLNNTTVQGVNQTILPTLSETLQRINSTSVQLEQLLSTINNNPAALVRGQAPKTPGPGE